MSKFEELPVEMVEKIFEMCSSIKDVVAFASTCKLANRAFKGPHKLRIVESIVHIQYGPIQDAINLVTYNETQNSSAQGTPAISLALLKQIDQVGRVANQWADLYPMEKWKWNYESRRLLTSHERYKVRRAVYRIWLYCNTFHSASHDERPRYSFYIQGGKKANFQFISKFTSKEAEEMLDIDSIIGRLLQELCPHNGMISALAREQHPNRQLFFGSLSSNNNNNNTYSSHHDPSSALEYESWGDSTTVEGIIRSLKKLNPRQLLQFRELQGKGERKAFLREMDVEFEGLFRGVWSELTWVLCMYLRVDEEGKEDVEVNGGIIAGDEDV